MYVPTSLAKPDADKKDCRFLVVIHGTERGNQILRDIFVDFAEEQKYVVIAPLFPCGIVERDDRDNYKYIEYKNIRYDLVLSHMLDEIASHYSFEIDRVSMFGFSGGAHFTHRFLYLHPRQLEAVSICAPGSVTLLDDNKPWWLGTSDMEEKFGIAPDIEAMKKVSVHLAVGEKDLETWEITHYPGSAHWLPGANDGGRTRGERLATLAANLRAHGLLVELETLPGVAHQRDPMTKAAMAFFRRLGKPV